MAPECLREPKPQLFLSTEWCLGWQQARLSPDQPASPALRGLQRAQAVGTGERWVS